VSEAVVSDIVEFKGGGGREDDIGQRGRRGHEDIRYCEEIQVGQGLVGHGTVRKGHQGVGALHVGPLDGIGNTLQNRLSEQGRRHVHEHGDGPVVGVKHFEPLIGKLIGPDKFPETEDIGLIGLDISTRDIQIAAHGHQTDQ